MLPTSAGVEPATSWSPVGRRIQLSHRGRQETICMKCQILFSKKNISKCRLLKILPRVLSVKQPVNFLTTCVSAGWMANSVDSDQTASSGTCYLGQHCLFYMHVSPSSWDKHGTEKGQQYPKMSPQFLRCWQIMGVLEQFMSSCKRDWTHKQNGIPMFMFPASSQHGLYP